MYELERSLICRYIAYLLGELDTADSSDKAPLAEQLVYLQHDGGSILALDWTQVSDGLLVADSSGAVTMYHSQISGK